MHSVLITVLPAFSLGCILTAVLGREQLAEMTLALICLLAGVRRWGRLQINPILAGVAFLMGTMHVADDHLAAVRVPSGPVGAIGRVDDVAAAIQNRPPLVYFSEIQLHESEVRIPRASVEWTEDTPTPAPGSWTSFNGWLDWESGRARFQLASPVSVIEINEKQSWLDRKVTSLRQFVNDRLTEGISAAPREVVLALVTGQTDRSSPLSQNLKACGGLHLFAVSGLHMGLLLLLLLRLTPAASLPLWPQACVAVVVLLGYAMMTGSRPPVLRALICVTLMLLARLVKRPVDPGWVLCAASAGLLLLAPALSRDLGFLMSFSALSGIVFLARPVLNLTRTAHDRWLLRKGIGRLRQIVHATFITGVAATLATLCITIAFFHGASTLSPITTLVLLPFVIVLMLLAPLVIAFPSCGLIVEAPAEAVIQLSEWLACVPGSYFETLNPSPYLLAVHCGMLVAAGFLMSACNESSRRRLLVLPITSACLLLATSGPGAPPVVRIVDTGDSRAVICCSGKVIAVIAPLGSRHDDGGARRVASVLSRGGEQVIDRVFLRRNDANSQRFLRNLSTRVKVLGVASIADGHNWVKGSLSIMQLKSNRSDSGYIVAVGEEPVVGIPSGYEWPAERSKVPMLVLPTMTPGQASSLIRKARPSVVIPDRNHPSDNLLRVLHEHGMRIERPRGLQTINR